MKAGKTLKILGKNILAFLIGAALGVASVILFILPSALEKALAGKEPGAVLAGAIALPAVFLVIYGVLGAIVGGLGAIIIYNIAKLILRRR
jgi:hypothetical protein